MSDTDNTPSAEDQAGAQEAHQAPEMFSKEYVQELRNEAARYRTQKNEAVEQTKAALEADFTSKLAEKDVAVTELQNQLGAAWVELEKVYTAIEAKIPSDKVRAFAAILQGNDKDSISESAKSAKELFGGLDSKSPAYDPTQGSGGGVLPLNGDPLLNALKKVVGI
jgi:hypothetical protein